MNTAGAIMAYAYDVPSVFVETNVRTVYIHHFFADRSNVTDKEVLALVERTLDDEHPREFYWALMDYGTHLKTTVGNLNRASRHYARQSKFQGSRRQLRGAIIRTLGQSPQTSEELQGAYSDPRLPEVLGELLAEKMIRQTDGQYRL